MFRHLLTAVSLALFLATPAWAAPLDPAVEDPRGERVSDAISKVRAKAAARDVNKDGWLSEGETSGGRDKFGGLLYGAIERKVDANSDGRVAVREYIDAQAHALKAADVDQDGWITHSEAKAQKRRLIRELLQGS